jgi:hypothetical protein
MVSENVDPFVAEVATRRAQAEAHENYVVKTQQLAQLSTRTKFVNMDTGEISYATLTEDGQLSVEGLANPVAQSQASVPLPSHDASMYYRRARLGVVAVIVLVFLWLWIREKRSR